MGRPQAVLVAPDSARQHRTRLRPSINEIRETLDMPPCRPSSQLCLLGGPHLPQQNVVVDSRPICACERSTCSFCNYPLFMTKHGCARPLAPAARLAHCLRAFARNHSHNHNGPVPHLGPSPTGVLVSSLQAAQGPL